MTMTYLNREGVAARIEAWTGHVHGSVESIAELIRAEVHARGTTLKTVVIERVARRLSAINGGTIETVKEVCDALEREGDLVAKPGGYLCATPLRVIALADGARLVGGIPTSALRRTLGGVVSSGPTRSTVAIDPKAIATLGGVLLSAATWAGLDHAPFADGAWLEQLTSRLEWAAASAGSLERDEALDWRALSMAREGIEWRRTTSAKQLWRARNRCGHWLWAWTAAGTSPSTQSFVRLTRDEANRTVFAIASAQEWPVRGLIENTATSSRLTLNVSLPSAEYRYLSIQSDKAERGPGRSSWVLRPELSNEVQGELSRRLGIVWASRGAAPGITDKNAGVSASREPHNVSTTDVGFADRTALDDHVPVEMAMGPLLRRLNIYRYRDLLTLDLGALEGRPGIGRLKINRLRQLINEAERRAKAAHVGLPDSRGIETNRMPLRYDDWSPLRALGRLPARALAVIEQFGLETIEDLSEWHENVDPDSVGNYSRKTHRALSELLRHLATEGHEPLVFGGPTPRTIQELAERYLDRLDSRERQVFSLRFPAGKILDQIGQEFGITRERVRQLIDTELSRDRPSWGPRARELLEPAFTALETRGGITLTKRVLERLGAPPLWAVHLAMALAEVSINFDIVDGLTTTRSREDFEETRRELRQEAELILTDDLAASGVKATLAEAGLEIEGEDLAEFAEAMLGVTIEGERAYPSRRATVGRYLSALHDAKGPVTAEEVAQRALIADPSLTVSGRSVISAFRRTPQALSYDHGLWIHQDHMPISRAALDALAREVLPEVRMARGQAVTIRKVLARLVDEGRAPANLSPYLLRDALIQTREVRGWRAGTDVAWLGGDVNKKSVSKWIDEVARELDQPFSADELMAEVAERSGSLPSTIYTNIQNQSGNLLPLTHAQFVHPDAAFASRAEYEAALRHVAGVVQSARIYSAQGETLAFPDIRPLTERFGRRIIWGLASRAPGLTTRARGLLAWPSHLGETVWSVVAEAFLQRHPVFVTKDFAQFLTAEAGLDNEDIPYVLMGEGIAEGFIRPLGMRWYIDARLSHEAQVGLLANHPQVLPIALGSQDFVRESPARELFNDVRERHGSFRVPAG